MDEDAERRALIGIAAMTVGTGAAQAARPGTLLGLLRAPQDAGTRHAFGTVGMFMVCIGGILLGSLRGGSGDPGAALLGTAAQKLGAAGAVSLGVRRGIFSPLALGVAAFDALSGLLALDYWRRVRR